MAAPTRTPAAMPRPMPCPPFHFAWASPTPAVMLVAMVMAARAAAAMVLVMALSVRLVGAGLAGRITMGVGRSAKGSGALKLILGPPRRPPRLHRDPRGLDSPGGRALIPPPAI